MDIRADIGEVLAFSVVMGQDAPGMISEEMAASAHVALHEGIGFAKENAPVDKGDLKNDIRVLSGPTADGGSYGTDLVYAWMREEGGTIVPRNAKALAIPIPGATRNGRPLVVFAKSVTQTGTKYMQRSAESLESRLRPIYERGVDRILGRI